MEEHDADGDELTLREGDVVMFTYDNYSRYAVPINPRIYRVRTDVTWEHVVHNYHKDTQMQQLNIHGMP